MEKIKKINLKGISEILSERELKDVMGGSSNCSNNTCSYQVACCYSSDWCVNGYCKSR